MHLINDFKKTGDPPFILFSAPKLPFHMLMDVKPMISLVLPRAVREKVKMQGLFHITSTQKTTNQPAV